MDKLSTWKEQIARLDAALRPIAQHPMGCLGLLFKPRRWTHPLDMAGVRVAAASVQTRAASLGSM